MMLSVAVITDLGSKAQMLLLWAALLCTQAVLEGRETRCVGSCQPGVLKRAALVISLCLALGWQGTAWVLPLSWGCACWRSDATSRNLWFTPQLAARESKAHGAWRNHYLLAGLRPHLHLHAILQWGSGTTWVPGVYLSGGYRLEWILLQHSYKAIVSEFCCWWRIGLTAFLNRYYEALNLCSGHKTGE